MYLYSICIYHIYPLFCYVFKPIHSPQYIVLNYWLFTTFLVWYSVKASNHTLDI